MSTDATTPRSTSPASTATPLPDLSTFPDDPAVLKQMIAELLRALRSERRQREEIQQRLDALLVAEPVAEGEEEEELPLSLLL